MKRTARLIAINLAVFAVLAVAALGGVELYLRLTVPASAEGSIFEYTQKTPRYKVMRSNARVIAYGSELRTNELGFRDDKARLPPKRPGEFRIAVIGDSFTVSAGVDYDRIFTSLVEQDLRRRHPEAHVVNLGVAGYNIVQYEMVLNEVALGLKPDLILVALFPTNDFMDDTLDDNRRRAFGGAPLPDPGWFEDLYVYRAYLGRAEAKAQSLIAQLRSRARGSAPAPDPMVADWDENIAALQRIADTAKAHGIPLAVTALPHTFHFRKQRPLHNRVYAYCQAHGIPTFNLLEPFIASGVSESSLRLNPLDSHPNAAYNALAARYLAPYLESRMLALREGPLAAARAR